MTKRRNQKPSRTRKTVRKKVRGGRAVRPPQRAGGQDPESKPDGGAGASDVKADAVRSGDIRGAGDPGGAKGATDAVVSKKTQLADRLGINRQQIYKWLKRYGDLPGGPEGPWNVAEVNAWRRRTFKNGFDHQPSDPAAGSATGETPVPPASREEQHGDRHEQRQLRLPNIRASPYGGDAEDEALQQMLGGLPAPLARALSDAICVAQENPKVLADVFYKIEQSLKAKMEREIAEGKYIEMEVLDEALAALCVAFTVEINEWVVALPVQVQGMDAAGIGEVLSKRRAQAFDRLIAKREYELADARRLEEIKRMTDRLHHNRSGSAGGNGKQRRQQKKKQGRPSKRPAKSRRT